MFLSGWNDSSQGPLLPTLKEHYHVSRLPFLCDDSPHLSSITFRWDTSGYAILSDSSRLVLRMCSSRIGLGGEL